MPHTAQQPVRILYVEDDEGLGLLLQKRMGRHDFDVVHVTTGEEALEILKQEEFPVILLDYTLPTMDGIEVLKTIRPVNSTPAVIMLTAGGNEYLAVEALALGAEDYIIKDVNQTYLDFLPHVINAALKKQNLTKQNEQQQNSLHYYVEELERRNIELLQEVQERKELEDKLREAKDKAEAANIAKSEFLTNMSHEIRTPMNAVIGLANLLAISQPLTDKQREYIQTLQISADALLALINDVLDISRIESRSINLEHIPVDLSQMMQDMSNMLSVKAEEKGILFEVNDQRAKNTLYLSDPTRLQQIIMNLCSNGVKFTDKGCVTVTITSTESAPNLHAVTLSVQDTGIGIAPANLNTIFEKFMQADSSINRKYGGTGLGLAITKTLVEAMGGTISVASEVHKGSTFTVTIPLPAAAAGVIATPHPQQTTFTKPAPMQIKPCVLIVEDYAPNVLVASTFLEEFGYDYDVASNGFDALTKIKANSYAAVLMDVQMQQMDGLETTRQVRQHEQQHAKSRVAIIGMTAHALMGDKERCLEAGMDDYISKPFHPDDLKNKLQHHTSQVKTPPQAA